MLASKIAWAVAAAMAATPAIFSAPEFMAQLDERLRPVITDVTAQPVSFGSDKYRVSVQGHKRRNCFPVTFSAFGVVDGFAHEVNFAFIDDTSPGSSKPTGKVNFGVWEFDLSPAPKSTEVFLYVKHSCGSPWLLSTKIGPWPVDRKALK